MTVLADTTVTIIFEPLALSDPPAGKFEPGQQANTALDSFESLRNNAGEKNCQNSNWST